MCLEKVAAAEGQPLFLFRKMKKIQYRGDKDEQY